MHHFYPEVTAFLATVPPDVLALAKRLAYQSSEFGATRDETVECFSFTSGETWSLEAFMELVQEAVSKVPEDKRIDVRVELDFGCDGEGDFQMYYRQPETVRDALGRVHGCVQRALQVSNAERQEFLRLKAKYGE